MNIIAKQSRGASLLLLGGWSGGAFAYLRRDAALRHRKDTTLLPLHRALPVGEGQVVRLEDIARCLRDGDGTDAFLGLLASFNFLSLCSGSFLLRTVPQQQKERGGNAEFPQSDDLST